MQLVSAGSGATIGVAIWVLLFTLGVPWVLHIGAFDGVWPCAAVGAVLGWFRLNHYSIIAGAALTILLLVVAYTPIIVAPAKSFIRNDPLPDHADAIMVLSAGVSDDGMISPAAVDRLIKGLQLLRRGVAPLIVVSREAYNVDG